MRITVSAVIIFGFLGGLSYAQQPESCDGNTYEVAVCLRGVLKNADSELNSVYQKALASAAGYTAEDVRNLRDAERKWILYRDAACKAERGLLGLGTAGPATQSICLIRITKQRTDDLRAAYLLP